MNLKSLCNSKLTSFNLKLLKILFQKTFVKLKKKISFYRQKHYCLNLAHLIQNIY